MKHYIPHVKPGTAPGSLTSASDALASQVSVVAYDTEMCTSYSLEDLCANRIVLGENQTLWVHVVGLKTIEMIKQLGQYFHLHPLALEDTVNSYQRSKVDNFKHYQFIVTRFVHLENKELKRQQLSLFLGKNFILSFLERPSPLTKHFQKALQNQLSRLRTRGADYFAYEILDYVTDSFFPVMHTYSDQLDLLENEVIAASGASLVHSVQVLKRQLRALKLLIWSHRDMLNVLTRNELNLIHDEHLVYFRDCYDHAIQQIDILESQRDSTNSLVDIYLSSVANRVNQVMKVLTVISVVFMPPMLLAGVWGMNFVNMPELHWHYGYLFAWTTMILTSVIIYYAFWRSGWMRSNN